MVRGPPCKFFLRFNKNLAGGFQTYSYCQKNSRGSKEESTSSDCSLGETWGPVTKDFKRDTQSNIYFFPWVFSRDPAQLMSNIILHQVFFYRIANSDAEMTQFFWHTFFLSKRHNSDTISICISLLWDPFREMPCSKKKTVVMKWFGGYGSYHPRRQESKIHVVCNFL